MKPHNPVYVGGPPLDPPDETPLIRCTFCNARFLSNEWRANRGNCPLCQKAYSGPNNED